MIIINQLYLCLIKSETLYTIKICLSIKNLNLSSIQYLIYLQNYFSYKFELFIEYYT